MLLKVFSMLTCIMTQSGLVKEGLDAKRDGLIASKG
jgi:hypothetical protein